MPVYSISDAPKGRYFLGVSLMSNGFFSKGTVQEYYNALGKKAVSFLVVIGDSLERWNYEYFKGLCPHSATQRALKVGRQYQLGYIKLRKVLPNFSVLLTSEIETNGRITHISTTLREFYAENGNFRKAVKLQVKENIGEKLQCEDINSVPDLLTNYIIDEIAITIAMYSGISMEPRIQISPKIDKLLVDLYNGSFQELSHLLNIKSSQLRYVAYNPKAGRDNDNAPI